MNPTALLLPEDSELANTNPHQVPSRLIRFPEMFVLGLRLELIDNAYVET
jgi:hypothetical protein